MISLNGVICHPRAFNWYEDSGFRYGYGCFETMRMTGARVPRLSDHMQRLCHSLTALGMDAYSPDDVATRIERLHHALFDGDDTPKICRVHVTGGAIDVEPGFSCTPCEIIRISPMPPSTGCVDVMPSISFQSVTPWWFMQHKTMAYAPHIHYLKSATAWPIYVDDADRVMDATIYAVGVMVNHDVFLADHPYQLPSIAKAYFIRHKKARAMAITRQDCQTADAIVGCNAVRGMTLLACHNEAARSSIEATMTTMNASLFDLR